MEVYGQFHNIRFTLGEIAPSTNKIGGRMAPKTVLTVENETISWLYPGSNDDSYVV
jgi:hypothetical protein